MTMMFEVEDLAVASPATVSRCGMIYLEPESLTLAPLVTSWFNTLPPKVSGSKYVMSTLTEMMDQLLEPGCYFLRRNLGEMVMTVDNNLAGSIMRLLDCYFVKYIESEIKKITPEQVAELEKQIKHIFFFCLIWSVGGTTNAPGREKFNKWCREQMQKHGLTGFPEEKLVYDWQYNIETSEWVNWFSTISEFIVDTNVSYAEIVVPTQDSIRMKYLMSTLIKNDKHILMPGPTGTGKSVYVQELVQFQMPEEFQTLIMCFSAQTSAN